MITASNLSKNFGPTVALKDVSFEVKKSEVLGFLGPNGAGKTTTMRILTCYHPADSGTATIAGFDVFDDPLEVRKLIGYLPENNPLYMDMGIVDYLEFIAKVRAIPPSKRKDQIRHVVELCGLQKELGKDIGELSKGFRQRVGLAQALIHDPDILILDEPTIGLDPTQIEVLTDDHSLLVRGIRREPAQEGKKHFHKMEISVGPFARRVPIAVDVDPTSALYQ